MASIGAAVAQSLDYKAIVCLFLAGGNDSANTVLATDADSWTAYENHRGQLPTPIALRRTGTPPDSGAPGGSPAALGGVLPIAPAFGVNASDNRNRTYALHPALPEVAALFNAGRLAIIANAGPLVEPLTQAEYLASSRRRPAKLFSHNDQQSAWQALAPEGASVGWGGRMGDLLASMNRSMSFTSIALSGNATFLSGRTAFQYHVTNQGTVAIAGLEGSLFGSTAAAAQLRSIITAQNRHLFAEEYAKVTRRSIEAQAIFQSAFAASNVPEPGPYISPVTRGAGTNSLSRQLQTVARIIGARDALGMRRQVFFVNVPGFDTHDNQNRVHAELLGRMSHALSYFDTTLDGLGVRDAVTLFTASDFGRAFSTNGDGTDHGWGGHQFVLGGNNIRGNEIYGAFPAAGVNHPDDVGAGRLLPRISVEQIGATLGRWFGCSPTDLSAIFPNLGNFAPQTDLGFVT